MSKGVLNMMGLGFALAPSAAWAHGDHGGLRGVVHSLTEPEHLGVALLVLLALGTALRLRRPPRKGDDAA